MLTQCETLLSDILGKKLIIDDIQNVYNYQDPKEDPDFRAGGDFL